MNIYRIIYFHLSEHLIFILIYSENKPNKRRYPNKEDPKCVLSPWSIHIWNDNNSVYYWWMYDAGTEQAEGSVYYYYYFFIFYISGFHDWQLRKINEWGDTCSAPACRGTEYLSTLLFVFMRIYSPNKTQEYQNVFFNIIRTEAK